MTQSSCFSCGKPIANHPSFCPFCLSQLKCRKCSTALIKDAIGCTECGEPIAAKSGTAVNVLNEMEYEQKGDIKRFKASFTNEVGHTLVETFCHSVMGNGLAPKRKLNPFLGNRTDNGLPVSALKPAITAEDIEIEVDDTDINEALASIFKVQDGSLVLVNPRLKQTGKLDNAIRLSILSLLAYERMDKQGMSRKILGTILKASKLNVPVFSTWLNQCDEITKNNNLLELTVPGREIAVAILKEIADPTITAGQLQFSKTSSSNTHKRKKSSPEAGASSTPDKEKAVSAKQPTGTNKGSYQLEVNLNLNPAGHPSFKDFFSQYKPKNHPEYILLMVYYLQKMIETKNIGINTIYTCYKQLPIKVPNIVTALNNIRTRKGWIDSSDWNNLTITVSGENHLEHDMKKSTATK